MTLWSYDFKCTHCGNDFDELLERKDVQVKLDQGKEVTQTCPECGNQAAYVPIGSPGHGYHRTSWKVT